jgi:peptide deformylase
LTGGSARGKRERTMKQPPTIVRAGHPVLRAPAAAVSDELIGSRDLDALVRSMVAAMRAAPGVGLAAPQLGVSLRVVVLEDREELMARLAPADRAARERAPFPLTALVNPVLRAVGDDTATFFEGCLSVPGYMALVERAREVEVVARDPQGAPVSLRVRGWPARILQHEIDHLDGSLYVDRMISRTLSTNGECQSRWLSRPAGEVCAELHAEPPSTARSGRS